MTARLQQFDKRLSEAFAAKDLRESHERASKILADMASDPAVLHDIVCRNIAQPDFFERKRINPVIAMKISEDRNYTLIGHLWLPLDDGATHLTHQSVHHHGNLLLTSMSGWGDGYESVLFKKGFQVVGANGETEMQIDKIYKNPLGHIEFVDQDTPHVVFFPAGFTVTYALWSREQPQTAASWAKKLPGFQTYKKHIKAALKKMGLASGLGLNMVENIDFYPRAGRLIQMKQRVTYAPGTRENYLDNFFWSLQQMKFDRLGYLAERIPAVEGPARTQALNLLSRFEQGETLPRRMEKIHLGVERVQFTRQELLGCFPEHGGGAGARERPRAG